MAKKKLISNPYKEIDWHAIEQHRANLHTHTTVSDGCPHPHQAIDKYKNGSSMNCCEWEFIESQCPYLGNNNQLTVEEGTPILAITDHNKVPHPWIDLANETRRTEYRGPCVNEPKENRDPKALGMIEIPGNEFSHTDHLVSLYCDAEQTPEDDYHSSIAKIQAKNGLAFWAHPGKYHSPGDAEFYSEYFYEYPCLIGVEAYSWVNKSQGHQELWDAILTNLMPKRQVWGFSNDDLHSGKHLFTHYNTVLVDELTDERVRKALEQGNFYFSYSPNRIAPKITNVKINEQEQTISISGQNWRTIEWISNGEVIATGEKFDYSDCQLLGNYVRAILKGEGETCTQPFGFN